MPLKITTTYYRPDTSVEWWVRPADFTTREEDGLPSWLDSSVEISSDGLALTEIFVGDESWPDTPRKVEDSKNAYYGDHDGTIFRWERLYELLDESGNLIKAYPSYRDFRAEHPLP
jgi:hypothetical protein